MQVQDSPSERCSLSRPASAACQPGPGFPGNQSMVAACVQQPVGTTGHGRTNQSTGSLLSSPVSSSTDHLSRLSGTSSNDNNNVTEQLPLAAMGNMHRLSRHRDCTSPSSHWQSTGSNIAICTWLLPRDAKARADGAVQPGCNRIDTLSSPAQPSSLPGLPFRGPTRAISPQGVCIPRWFLSISLGAWPPIDAALGAGPGRRPWLTDGLTARQQQSISGLGAKGKGPAEAQIGPYADGSWELVAGRRDSREDGRAAGGMERGRRVAECHPRKPSPSSSSSPNPA